MQIDEVIRLPEQDVMMQRLKETDDGPSLIAHLYPLILTRLAGQERNILGVVRGIELAIYDYTAELPMPRLAEFSFRLRMPEWVTAVLPPNSPVDLSGLTGETK